MKPKWIFKDKPNENILQQLKSKLNCEDLEALILALRNLTDLEQIKIFFRLKEEDIHDPFLMKNMHKAVERIATAVENGEKILIYGDYDVDGTTSVSLMYRYLAEIYDEKFLDFYIPDRYAEGYGISFQGIDFAKENGISLVIALDCGIKSIKEIDYASSLGIDFVICDHHLPGDEIPKATAVLDPKQKDCLYPYKELSGCGVGFKLCQALNSIYKIPSEKIYDLTDLLAISIASDIVPITGENRTLAKLGLKKLHNTQKMGLKYLIPEEHRKNFTISNIVFEIGPKINAAGRISHGKNAVKLMISNDENEAEKIVKEICELNSQRREMDKQTTTEAVQQIIDTEQDKKFSIIVYDPNWNKGIVGITASRITELYYKPTIVFTDGSEGEVVASARSVSDFDIYKALEKCSHLLEKFGGHQAAAGLTLKKENFEEFKTLFEKVVSEQIQEHQKTPIIEIDCEIKLNQLNEKFFSFHQKLAPFGPQNMRPVFAIKNISNPKFVQLIGKDKSHLKFYLPSENRNIECTGFKLGSYHEDLQKKNFDMVFSIEENHWKGDTRHILHIKDIQFNS
jgi:single-stranded-DNA-specific exonuclease recJ